MRIQDHAGFDLASMPPERLVPPAGMESDRGERRGLGAWTRGVIGALAVCAAVTAAAAGGPDVVLVVGAPGEDAFRPALQRQEESWRTAVERAGGRIAVVGSLQAADRPAEAGRAEGGGSGADGLTDLVRLERLLAERTAERETEPLWVVLAGHGTFDGEEARFNLRGPDLAAGQLAAWLETVRRPLAVIVASSSSGPFVPRLSRPGRVVIAATRSGYEQNYARFGEHFAASLEASESDLDRDGQVSLLETFLRAAHLTEEFYRADGRLLTEHALIEDTGDGKGTPAEWFRGIRAVKTAEEAAAPDGRRAHQWHLSPGAAERALTPERRARRDALEGELEALRGRKTGMPADTYDRALERILLELARVYDVGSS
jgi:hypothetical protein